MSIQSQRIFLSDNGALSDLTDSLNDFRAGTATAALVKDEDYIYVFSDLPFNHRHFEVSTANDVACVSTVEIWWASAWHDAVDVLDKTATSGKSLAKSGIIQFQPDDSKGWDRISKTSDITELASLKLFSVYAARFSWSASLKATTALAHIGHKFSDDTTLQSYYPDLANTDLMAAFKTGKADWNEQHFMAAETIIADLRRRQIVGSGNQILDWELFTPASCHKVAELVYRGLGRSYFDDAQASLAQYEKALAVKFPNVDRYIDGRLSDSERKASTGWISR